MTERRMTTSISKSALREFLRKNGMQISSTDLAAFLEEIAPKSSQKILSYALDFFRPLTRGMGIRVVRLSETQVELVLPCQSKNLSQDGHILEAAIVTAGIEAVRTQWLRHAPLGGFSFQVKELRFVMHKKPVSSLRLRMEMSPAHREKCLADLRSLRAAESDHEVGVFDENDQKLAELYVKVGLEWTPALNSTKDGERGNS